MTTTVSRIRRLDRAVVVDDLERAEQAQVHRPIRPDSARYVLLELAAILLELASAAEHDVADRDDADE